MAATRQTDECAHETTATAARTRRGLIAGAAALVAAALAARAAPDEVAAQGEPLVVGNGADAPGYQVATSRTWLATGNIGAAPALRATNNYGAAPDDRADGVQGFAAGNASAGVFGRNAGGYGVWGYSTDGVGALGQSGNNIGLYGVSGTYTGVYGVSGLFGVYGTSSRTVSGAAGVYGFADRDNAFAVLGTVAPGIQSHGVAGYCGTAGTAGIYGEATSAAAYAGRFKGQVLVQGDFAVTGAKSAALPHPDGTRRLVYCVESPESWLEDFGTGTLSGGRAEIALDPDFAAVADTARMHIFVSEREEHHGLHVPSQSATGFVVQASAETLAARGKAAREVNTTFAYRVVARRKDLKAQRLAKLAEPPPLPQLRPPPPLPPPPVPRPATG